MMPSDQAHKIHRGRSFEHHTGDSTIWLSSVPLPVLKENIMEMVRGLPPTSQEDLQFDEYLEYTSTIYIYKYPMPSPRFKPRPYGTAVNITDYYTGWYSAGG
ncbi:hypothetical protein TNCV_1693261 [Trichonephila clavipes]|nr:hypothetical protein TNCV_1693261 [Trichonephila clavipes]